MDTLSQEILNALFGYNPIDSNYYYLANKNQSFPKYNLIKKDNNDIVIELALAGYKRSEINIIVDNNILTIKTVKSEEDGNKAEVNYITNGIAHRQFNISTRLPEFYEVTDASMEDGMLSITLHQEIPEHLKPKKIEIK